MVLEHEFDILLAAPGGTGQPGPGVKPRVTLRDPEPYSSQPASPSDTAAQHTTGEGMRGTESRKSLQNNCDGQIFPFILPLVVRNA